MCRGVSAVLGILPEVSVPKVLDDSIALVMTRDFQRGDVILIRCELADVIVRGVFLVPKDYQGTVVTVDGWQTFYLVSSSNRVKVE